MARRLISGAVDISIDVYSRIAGSADALSPGARDEVEAVMDDLIAELREYLIDTWPVDTGRSQQSWSLQWEPPLWVIRNPVEYAEFVHDKGSTLESWVLVEAESEQLINGALGRLNEIVQRDNVASLDIQIQRQQNLADRLGRQARRLLRTSLFAATVEAYQDRPSRLRERESLERQRLRLRGR